MKFLIGAIHFNYFLKQHGALPGEATKFDYVGGNLVSNNRIKQMKIVYPLLDRIHIRYGVGKWLDMVTRFQEA